MVTLVAEDPVSREFRAAIGAQISAFLDEQRRVLAGIGPELSPLADLASTFTDGGKRLRPAFCVWGRVAAGGPPDDLLPLLRAAASLDVLHVSALVHDDVMDGSDTRRGVASGHRQLQALHAGAGWRGASDAFGKAGAILLGDLLLVWSQEMFRRAGLSAEALLRATPLLEAVRTEVTAGQFLDIVAQARSPLEARHDPVATLDEVNRVVEYKTARYTVVRPLQIGAALAGADQVLQAAMSAFGSPLGRAFQFRDDILGVFGDPEVTGKPAGDDLREGKFTVLTAHAMAAASPAGASRLASLLGADLTADEVEEARRIIVEAGALAAVEAEIDRSLGQGLDALDRAPITSAGRIALTTLAHLAVDRAS